MTKYADLANNLKPFADVTRGSKFGAMINACLMGEDQPEGNPRFTGPATITKDGWVMWDFTTGDGTLHRAFAVGRFIDFKAECLGVVKHLGLNEELIPHRVVIADFFKAMNANFRNYSDTALNFQKEARGVIQKMEGHKNLVTEPTDASRK